MTREPMYSNKGFTLLELMIASSVFIVGIVAVLQSFVGSNDLRMDAEQRTTIQLRTHTVMDQLYRADLEQLENYTPPEFDGFPQFEVEVFYIAENGQKVQPPISEGVVLPNPLEVFVTTTSTFSSGRQLITTTPTIMRR